MFLDLTKLSWALVRRKDGMGTFFASWSSRQYRLAVCLSMCRVESM
jgi:hypothetical protein